MAVHFVGFDSAWSDNPRAWDAICGWSRAGDAAPRFHPPRRVGFDAALAFIGELHRPGDLTLVAIDQPTIVPNKTGMRPAERVVAGTMSRSGGAIQPAYRGKASMFGDGAPIWRFLDGLRRLGFADDPESAACAPHGGFVMESYPALALLSLDPAFVAVGRAGPRYNPSRPTFRQAAWAAVCRATAREAEHLGLDEAAAWCKALDVAERPRKPLQDEIDAVVCLLIAVRWRTKRARCVMVGDLAYGYIVAPVAPAVRAGLGRAAERLDVPIR